MNIQDLLEAGQEALLDGDAEHALRCAKKVISAAPLNGDAKKLMHAAMRARKDTDSPKPTRAAVVDAAPNQEVQPWRATGSSSGVGEWTSAVQRQSAPASRPADPSESFRSLRPGFKVGSSSSSSWQPPAADSAYHDTSAASSATPAAAAAAEEIDSRRFRPGTSSAYHTKAEAAPSAQLPVSVSQPAADPKPTLRARLHTWWSGLWDSEPMAMPASNPTADLDQPIIALPEWLRWQSIKASVATLRMGKYDGGLRRSILIGSYGAIVVWTASAIYITRSAFFAKPKEVVSRNTSVAAPAQTTAAPRTIPAPIPAAAVTSTIAPVASPVPAAEPAVSIEAPIATLKGLLAEKRFADAVKIGSDALQAVPAAAPKRDELANLLLAGYNGLGEQLLGTGDFAGAINAYEKSVGLAPQSAQQSLYLGNAHYYNGIGLLDKRSAGLAKVEFQKALASTERACVLKPDSLSARHRLATILEQLDRRTEARTAWQKVKQLAPAQSEAAANAEQRIRALTARQR